MICHRSANLRILSEFLFELLLPISLLIFFNMSAPESEIIEKLSHEETEYPSPRIVAENALLKDAKAEYECWRENPDRKSVV